jgi:hypothetical protein
MAVSFLVNKWTDFSAIIQKVIGFKKIEKREGEQAWTLPIPQ